MNSTERLIIENINPDFKAGYIARDADGSLWVFETKPVKGSATWSSDILHPPESLCLFQHLFDFIKWEDKEAWKMCGIKLKNS